MLISINSASVLPSGIFSGPSLVSRVAASRSRSFNLATLVTKHIYFIPNFNHSSEGGGKGRGGGMEAMESIDWVTMGIDYQQFDGIWRTVALRWGKNIASETTEGNVIYLTNLRRGCFDLLTLWLFVCKWDSVGATKSCGEVRGGDGGKEPASSISAECSKCHWDAGAILKSSVSLSLCLSVSLSPLPPMENQQELPWHKRPESNLILELYGANQTRNSTDWKWNGINGPDRLEVGSMDRRRLIGISRPFGRCMIIRQRRLVQCDSRRRRVKGWKMRRSCCLALASLPSASLS